MDLDYIRKLAGITPTDTYAAFDEDVDGWYSDDELIEELQEFLASPELCFLAEKKKGGFIAKAKAALSSLFGKKKAAAKKAPAKKAAPKAAAKAAPKEAPAKSKGGGKASAEPKRKLAPDEKMVFGVIRKIGKNGKLLPKDDAKKKSASKAQADADATPAKAAEPEKKASTSSGGNEGGGASGAGGGAAAEAPAKKNDAPPSKTETEILKNVEQFAKDDKLPASYSPQEKDPKDPREKVTKTAVGNGRLKAVFLDAELPGGITMTTNFDRSTGKYRTTFHDSDDLGGAPLVDDEADPGDVDDVEAAQKQASKLLYAARKTKEARKEAGYESVVSRHLPIAERMSTLLRKSGIRR